MIKLFNSKFISILSKILILIVIAKSLSLILWWYLPSDTIELSVKENYQPKYQRVNFKNMIERVKIKKVLKPKVVEKVVDTGISITSMLLKGLYGKQTKGFVIVAMKSTPKKTDIVGVGEEYQGYTLKAIFANSAKFHKDGSDFILSLDMPKDSTVAKRVKRKVDRSSSSSSRGATEAPAATVSRNDISYYAKNPNQIWRDISIKEVKSGNRIRGFKVTKIKRNSKFAKLGLKRGDMIIKANNVRLKSYRDALQIYKNIDKLDMIQIVVMRNNQEVELVYEIN